MPYVCPGVYNRRRDSDDPAPGVTSKQLYPTLTRIRADETAICSLADDVARHSYKH